MQISTTVADQPRTAGREFEAAPAHPRQNSLAAQLRVECDVMSRHILRQGLAAPSELIGRLAILLSPSREDGDGIGRDGGNDAYLGELADIHQKLIDVVTPATPQAIALLDPARSSGHRFSLLGPVPLIRMLTITAIGFMLAVLLTAVSHKVSTKNMELGLLDSSGLILLTNLLFLLFCAGLGASFATLFHAHRFIANVTYDPRYDASYSARLILGVIAGLIMAEMLPEQAFAQAGAHGYGKPALALLGGFSASAVHRVLQRLVETFEALVSGDTSAQHQSSMDTFKAKLYSNHEQSKNELVAQLLALNQALDADSSPDLIRQRVSDLARSMLAPQYKAVADDACASGPKA